MQDFKIFELFVFMSLPFWGLLLFELVFLFSCVSYKTNTPAIISILLLLVVLQFFGQIPIFQFIYENPLVILIYFLSYLLIGIIWAVIKWYLFVVDNYHKYDELMDSFIGIKKSERAEIVKNKLTPEQIKEWKIFFSKNSRFSEYNFWGVYQEYNLIDYKPNPKNYKNNITNWLMLWPFSLLNTLFADFLFKLFKHIYNCIKEFLTKITNHVWKDVQPLD